MKPYMCDVIETIATDLGLSQTAVVRMLERLLKERILAEGRVE